MLREKKIKQKWQAYYNKEEKAYTQARPMSPAAYQLQTHNYTQNSPVTIANITTTE